MYARDMNSKISAFCCMSIEMLRKGMLIILFLFVSIVFVLFVFWFYCISMLCMRFWSEDIGMIIFMIPTLFIISLLIWIAIYFCANQELQKSKGVLIENYYI